MADYLGVAVGLGVGLTGHHRSNTLAIGSGVGGTGGRNGTTTTTGNITTVVESQNVTVGGGITLQPRFVTFSTYSGCRDSHIRGSFRTFISFLLVS